MKKDIKLVFEDSKILDVFRGTTVREVLRELDDEQIIALRVNGNIVDSDFELLDDAYINYITIHDRVGQKIYTKGLEYIYIKAVKELYGGKASVRVKHSIDKALYTEIDMKGSLNELEVHNIKKKMKEICARDYKFKQISVSRHDAYEYVKSLGEEEKMLNYLYMTHDSITMYELDDDYNYFFYVMPPSTRYLKRFDLTFIAPRGIVLSYPINNVVPRFVPAPQVLDAFKTYENQLKNIGVKYAGDLNQKVIEGNIEDFIHTNEILYDRNMENIATMLSKNKNIKAIFISGPSSSGKTTTSKKLAMYLRSVGIDSLVLSTDDYFLNREDSPRKADGSYEFECVEALDINLFSKQLRQLLKGENVIIPTYNFIAGIKEYKRKPTTLKENQVLIVEGLHAINNKLNGTIPRKNKLKIYISPFTPIGLDRHNHISTTDLRFLRRMVRDYRHRGYTAEMTLNSWMGMRKSEETYVYPYQREADVIINTSLAYEIGVLRTYAVPLLYSISKESEYYEEAMRILKFLKGFINIPSEHVPQVSVLREFIGGSYFE